MHVMDLGSGRPLLLLHGWSCHGCFFGPQIEAFRSQVRVIVPDLPGHGRTGRNGPALGIEAAADAVHALIEDKALDGVVVVGWSMGAHVAYAMLDRHGADRIAALVVVDMTPKVLNGPDWRLGLADGLDARRNAGVLASIEAHWPQIAPRIAERIFARDLAADSDLLAYAAREIAAADPALLAPMWASLTTQDFRPLIPAIGVPVTLARGARSALYGPQVADWQAERLPHGRIVTFERSGHAPHLEEPAAFRDMLSGLL